MSKEIFTEAVVEDYVNNGFAEMVDEVTLKSLDGDTVIYLESIFDGEEDKGVEIFSNDVSIAELFYDEENFASKFNDIMMNELNV